MALEAGSPYEVEASIGGGGMGEVHRAKNNRIDRTVAIKVVASDDGVRRNIAALFCSTRVSNSTVTTGRKIEKTTKCARIR